MGDGTSARDRFERLAYVVSRSSRPEGAELAVLARDLGATEERILEDLRELTTRDEYRPGGWPGDIRVFVEAGRVQVEHTSFMDRPFRLTDRETVCLALALSGIMAAPTGDGSEQGVGGGQPSLRESFLRRAEQHLSQYADTAGTPNLAIPNRTAEERSIRATLKAAAYERRPCAIRYLKPGAEEPSCRVIHPYLVLYAEETWYVAACCIASDEVRVFRLDRVLSAEHREGVFEVPSAFDADAHAKAGPESWLLASGGEEALVRYSPKLAPWARERASYRNQSMDEHDDGSVTLRHRVVDPLWLATHILRYGVHAEVLEPQSLRDLVADLIREIATSVATAPDPTRPSGSHPTTAACIDQGRR